MADPHNEALARSAVYELLSMAFLYPDGEAAAQVADAARTLTPLASSLGWPQVKLALHDVSRQAGELTEPAFRDQYSQVFGHIISADCAPYEAEYGQAHVFQKSHTLADLNAFYNAFGVSANPEHKDRADHISTEMEFMHLLTLKEAYAREDTDGGENLGVCRKAQESFLANHLATWIDTFARRLVRKAGDGAVYASLGKLLETHMRREFEMFQLIATAADPVEPIDPNEDAQECYAAPWEGKPL
jgi:DMSO reductase family type II enzyme chaperone